VRGIDIWTRYNTDSSANRERRWQIRNGFLWILFDRKEANRPSSTEQRRIIWHSDDKRKCATSLAWFDRSRTTRCYRCSPLVEQRKSALRPRKLSGAL
jgi:hypothetical protein